MTRKAQRWELDATYRVDTATGIHAYTVALAQEIAESHVGDAVVLIRRGQDATVFGLPARRKRLLDHVRVPRRALRLIPHQMRLPPMFGPVVVTVHDVIHLGLWTPLAKRLVFTVLLGSFRRRNVHVLAVSHYTRARLLALGFDPTRVGVCQSTLPERSSSRTAADPGCDAGGFVYVGNLRPHKGVPFLLDAMTRVISDGVDVRLHIVTSATSAEIDALLSPLPDDVRQHVCLHHRAPDPERDLLISRSAAVVSPSFEEGYGYSLDEAHRAGVPVIASMIPAHIENSQGKDVLFVPPGDATALADAMVGLRGRVAPPVPGGLPLPLRRSLVDALSALHI